MDEEPESDVELCCSQCGLNFCAWHGDRRPMCNGVPGKPPKMYATAAEAARAQWGMEDKDA